MPGCVKQLKHLTPNVFYVLPYMIFYLHLQKSREQNSFIKDGKCMQINGHLIMILK